MKKIYATILAAALSAGAQAQVMERIDGASFTKFSDDAEWLVQNLQGTISIVRRSTGEQWESYDPEGLKLYMAGLGHSVTATGYLVGMAGDSAAVWHDGAWTPLPQPTGVGTTYNTGHSITPDGRRICGVLGNDGSSMTGENARVMAYPAVWTKNAAGEYEFQALPYPEKDFLGETPQFVTAVAMSDDGRTVVGQVRDYSGFYVIPIVWREDADGAWSYRMVGSDEIYDASKIGDLPPMPTPPTMPNANDYMSADDVDAYNAALEKYNEDLNKYYSGETDVYPDYPMMEDYISDAAKKADYQAAMAQYQKDQAQYMQDYTDYMTKREEIVHNKSYVQNTLCLSGNGRWLGVTLEDRGTGDYWGAGTTKTVGSFDLEQDDPRYAAATPAGDYLATATLNDGTLIYGTPSSAYTRNAFVSLPKADGSRSNVTFGDYLYDRSEAAGKWLEEHNTYDVEIWGYDDDGWTPIVTDVVEDSLVAGTVMANAEGTVFVGYYTDDLGAESSGQTVSYIIDLSSLAGIHATSSARGGETTEPRYYNLQGQLLREAPLKGVYVEQRGGKAVKRVAK